MPKHKKNYNPFTMILPYVMGLIFVAVAILGFYFELTGTGFFNFINSITIGDLYKVVPVGQNTQGTFGLFNPLAMLNLFIYGFLFGWLIESIFRLVRKKK